MHATLTRTLAAAALVLAASPLIAADSGLFADTNEIPGRDAYAYFQQLAEVRAATALYHRVDLAETDGYGAFFTCVDQPGLGAMGQHYVNAARLDATVAPTEPEALVYEPGRDGKLRLVAVEYIVFQDDWEDAHGPGAARPVLFGEHFHLVGAPNRYGLPPFYALHAWVWRHNPAGMFVDWNPRVRCPAGR